MKARDESCVPRYREYRHEKIGVRGNLFHIYRAVASINTTLHPWSDSLH